MPTESPAAYYSEIINKPVMLPPPEIRQPEEKPSLEISPVIEADLNPLDIQEEAAIEPLRPAVAEEVEITGHEEVPLTSEFKVEAPILEALPALTIEPMVTRPPAAEIVPQAKIKELPEAQFNPRPVQEVETTPAAPVIAEVAENHDPAMDEDILPIAEIIEPDEPDLTAIEVPQVEVNILTNVEAQKPPAESFVEKLAAAVVESEESHEEPVPLPQIIEQTRAEAPLDEVLIELAVFIAQAEEEMELPEAQGIREALADLSELLPEMEVLSAPTEQAQEINITLEITQKIAGLLQAIGYENPEATLQKFIAEYDVHTLLLTIRYLYQLLDESGNAESLSLSFSSNFAAPDHQSWRVGHFLCKLLAPSYSLQH